VKRRIGLAFSLIDDAEHLPDVFIGPNDPPIAHDVRDADDAPACSSFRLVGTFTPTPVCGDFLGVEL
jgi:hypothetical protein